MRIFSDISVRNGPDTNGLYTVQRIPIVYGDPSNLVAQIIKGGSENTMLPAPMFSAYIDSIKLAPTRRRDTQFVNTASTIERTFDPTTQTYTTDAGTRYDVERYMPVPYDIYFKLDCWTTNLTNKLQIFEQIGILFNPSIQLQQNADILDWTSIFGVWIDDFTWTNRSIPQGSDMQRDVMTWRFVSHAWINPPAKIKRSTLIAQIVANVYDSADVGDIKASIDPNTEYNVLESLFSSPPVQIITTYGNYKINVQQQAGNDIITLINTATNKPENWLTLIQAYGQIFGNITKMRLKTNPDPETDTSDIIGTIEQDPITPSNLIFTPDIDTLPANTLPAITTIIDPTEIMPGNGLPHAAAGQRYLLTSNTSAGEEPAIPLGAANNPWGSSVVAYPNDIIEYNGVNWTVIFNSRNSTSTEYAVNNADNTQYMFSGSNWTYSYYGTYAPGFWRVDNIVPPPQPNVLSAYDE